MRSARATTSARPISAADCAPSRRSPWAAPRRRPPRCGAARLCRRVTCAVRHGPLRREVDFPRELLHHHSHLLRERRAAPRPRLHDRGRRRAGAPSPPARRGRLLPDRHGRARHQGRAGGGGARAHAAAARGPAGAALPRACRGARRLQRLLHPHHRPGARGVRAGLRGEAQGRRRHREAQLRRPLLHRLRGLLVRARPHRRGPVPGPRHQAGLAGGGELLLPAEQVPGQARRVLPCEPRAS